MEKLLVVLSRFPYPLEKGDKLRAYQQIKILSKYYDIHLVTLNRNTPTKDQIEALNPYCKSIRSFKVSILQFLYNLFLFSVLGKPFQLSFFYNLKMKKYIETICIENKIRKGYFQLIRTAEYARNLNMDCYLDYMDTLSIGVFRQSSHLKGIKKWFYLLESRKLANYEEQVFPWFKKHFIISKQDQELFTFPESNEIIISPNGVSPLFLEDFHHSKDFDICFAGNLNYPPNIKAGLFIGKEILPKLPSVSCIFAGATPSQEIKAMASDTIHVSGYMKDIRTGYASAKIFVAPLFIGTGLQNKLLEAMALGIPCITTPLCNNALNAKPDHEILLANSAEEFAEKITFLLHSPDQLNEIGKNGKAFVEKNYNWNEIGLSLRNAIQKD